jgi:hypothetical protein
MPIAVEPARLDQIRCAYDGRIVMIDAAVGGVAADLKAIDPCLHVGFAKDADPPCFLIIYTSEDGRESYLVNSAQAHLNHAGVYEGLDQRIVERIREIDPRGRGKFNYAEELRKGHERRLEAQRRARREMLGEFGEIAAHAVRRDLGARYKGRAFIPREREP